MKLRHSLLLFAMLAVLVSGCARKQPQYGMSPEEIALRNRLEQSRADYGTAYRGQDQDQAAMNYIKKGGTSGSRSYIK